MARTSLRWLAAMALCISSLGLPSLASAQQWEAKREAELQTLDKVTARVSVLRAPVGQPVQFGTLNITVRTCNARPSDEVPDAAAWMEIRDSRRGAEAPPVFRGWMFANAPAVNTLEHPVYDVRVLECR